MSLPATPAPSGTSSLSARLREAWRVEFSNLRWRWLFLPLVGRLLPEGRAHGLRRAVLRAMGLDIGSGTRFVAMPKVQCSRPGPVKERLRVGVDCTIGRRVILEFGDRLVLGDRVRLDDGVVILTTTHELGTREHRAGPTTWSPVTVGNDVEIGENSILLPGAAIGDGARILAGSVVNSAVAAGTTVSGIPARLRRPT